MTPLTIYQRIINEMSVFLPARKPGRLGEMFGLPYLVSGLQSQVVFRGREGLHPVFAVLFRSFGKRGVTHFDRVARKSEYVRPDRIAGWPNSHIIASGQRRVPRRAAGCPPGLGGQR